jgi:menaquinone-9 beta-reductase
LPAVPTERCEVLVVGGGPAGSAAAITLASAGREVLLVDKARFPRDKCCGDGLTTGALRLLEDLAVDPRVLPSWKAVDAAWVRSPGGHEVRFPLPGDGVFAAVTPRAELDALLLERAAAAGAKVHEGASLTRIDTHRVGPAVVTVEGLGDIEARHVIAADGMWSPTRKALGLSEPGLLGEWHAFRQYVSGVTGPAAERLCVWFDADLLPGYAWSFPLPGGRANVGFGVLRTPGGGYSHGRSGKDLKALWPELLRRPHIAEALGPGWQPEAPHRAWPIPARIDRAVLAHGPVLFTGDAAAATDQLTGEGIGQALLTGVLAGEAVMAGRGDPAAVAGRYERDVQRALVADHRMSMVLSRVLASPAGADWSVRIAGATDWTRRNFARWLFEDEARAVALTPRRWHRRFLDRPGAFASRP